MSTPRPLFVYGTLRALPLLAWAVTGDASNTSTVQRFAHPAKVHDYTRLSVNHCDYPAVVKKESGEVDGYLLILETMSQRKKLDDFEGEAYKITPVEVVMEDGTRVEADMYVWDGDMEKLSDEPWELEWFVKERLGDWLDLFEGMELVGDDA
ncbi:AIG2-like family-domain-containing protein [Fusarium flagelliforme]|uniref:Putative gamma-glutamylcyclotransferase n=1 Tax=Fusarium flagelliforme TaxID=2675880 RepID=A0A395MS34_9HYPO|nr:AIG2-like family-domain-containing protein [Fusarium flagelliforme]KAH7189580.1 AIG2-like family-domain-containing protein [Fusarium flagelliforme]RFN50233.1 hypothetical protein FIE12Z_5412 [Fusarium flagelliforme]